MAQKFIIADGNLIIGNVSLHIDLAKGQKNIQGGGYWFIDEPSKTVVLYGTSIDFGTPTIDAIEKAIKHGYHRPNYSGHKYFISKWNDWEKAMDDFRARPHKVLTPEPKPNENSN